MWQGSAEAQVRGRAEAELRWAGQDPRGFGGGASSEALQDTVSEFPTQNP